jgi:hypothetical protein
MPKIEDIAFARLVSAGKVYRSACIVSEKGVNGKWWRKNGMTFSPEDFDSVIESKPEIVILGTGFMNKASVLPETVQRFAATGIELEAVDSATAAARYNELLAKGRRVIGAFHLM